MIRNCLIQNVIIYKIQQKMSSENLMQSFKHFTPSRSEKRLIKFCSLTAQSLIVQNSEDHKSKRKEKINSFNKSIDDKLKKLQHYSQIIKQKNMNAKTLKSTYETITSPKNHENNKLKVYNSLLDQQNSQTKNSLSSLATSPSQIVQQQTFSPKKKKVSPKKKFSKFLNSEDNNLKQIRQIESFIVDEEQQEVSIVEEQGHAVLDWEICLGKASQFKILKFLDQGKFGKVYLAQSHRNKVIYSVKSIYRCLMDESSFLQLIREVKIQSYLNHPNIVKLYNFFVDQESAYLVLEPCLGKNLYTNLKQMGRVPEKKVKEWIRQICNAIEYLHKNDIIHRDIKPENILLHENMVKICDFGWAVHSPLLRSTQCGTPLYTPPQILGKNSYDSKIDIWSIGILTYELLYGTIPFQIRHVADMAKIIEQQVYYSRQISVSEAAKDFMMCCLHKDPIQRSSIMQLRQHQFLNKVDKYRWTIM